MHAILYEIFHFLSHRFFLRSLLHPSGRFSTIRSDSYFHYFIAPRSQTGKRQQQAGRIRSSASTRCIEKRLLVPSRRRFRFGFCCWKHEIAPQLNDDKNLWLLAFSNLGRIYF